MFGTLCVRQSSYEPHVYKQVLIVNILVRTISYYGKDINFSIQSSLFGYIHLYRYSSYLVKVRPLLYGVGSLFRSDGSDKKVIEGSTFSIKNLDVPMNVGKVSDVIKKG